MQIEYLNSCYTSVIRRVNYLNFVETKYCDVCMGVFFCTKYAQSLPSWKYQRQLNRNKIKQLFWRTVGSLSYVSFIFRNQFIIVVLTSLMFDLAPRWASSGSSENVSSVIPTAIEKGYPLPSPALVYRTMLLYVLWYWQMQNL